MLCLQETKKEQVDKVLCQTLWGDSEISWEVQPAINKAEGRKEGKYHEFESLSLIFLTKLIFVNKKSDQ